MLDPCWLGLASMSDPCCLGLACHIRFLGVISVSDPRYLDLGCPAKCTHFGLESPPSPRVLDLTNMSNPHHVNLADF